MADYPTDIFEVRETENLPGLVYDANDKRNFFSEDFQNLAAEITAIEETLGINPQGSFSTVDDRIAAIAASLEQNSTVLVSTVLTPSELMNLVGTPKVIAPAIPGYVPLPVSLLYEFQYVAPAYLSGSTIRVETSSGVVVYAAGLSTAQIRGTSNFNSIPIAGAGISNVSSGDALVLKAVSTNYTTGAGILTVHFLVKYIPI